MAVAYEATKKFEETYKKDSKDTKLLLILSGNDNELKVERATKRLKQFLDLTEKESKGFTPKIWCHAWGNWGSRPS